MQERLWSEAAAAATERRAQIAGIRTKSSWEGVLQWERPPVAGKRATALYNKASGALRCLPVACLVRELWGRDEQLYGWLVFLRSSKRFAAFAK